MKLFDVYPRFDIEITKGQGSFVEDVNGIRYLDFYGGHAVVSIGHSHPHYINRVSEQLNNLGFYSNSVQMPIQQELADHLGKLSGYDNYELFLVNSGAEANENALKLASFHTGKKKVINFSGAFHGRTSAAVQCTDNPKIIAPINKGFEVKTLPLNDIDQLQQSMDDDVAAIIVEGIQGIGGIHIPSNEFLTACRELTNHHNSILILDEIQSGYGRSGKFFAHQYAPGLKPDIITVAKGMGNGFPVGAVLINPEIESSYGLLGTTFGGNHLACAASLAVLEVIEKENLILNAYKMGEILQKELAKIPQIKQIRGLGLMIALDFDFPIKDIRKKLIFDKKVFTGSAKSPNTMRILPPLNINITEINIFISSLKEIIESR
ncbi:aspartate aminotransferase family protein [Membranihabitans maritimus]|uniref:aspartate aminotransferase family protein n=1 Tax=Membranihabitans maritimus TaxID=2904244 RepID=UPI001F01924C|nr:aminotransferase class III-fold pyridoxal phosphate-dependent enzyme [Membranihabitans maritimus]